MHIPQVTEQFADETVQLAFHVLPGMDTDDVMAIVNAFLCLGRRELARHYADIAAVQQFIEDQRSELLAKMLEPSLS